MSKRRRRQRVAAPTGPMAADVAQAAGEAPAMAEPSRLKQLIGGGRLRDLGYSALAGLVLQRMMRVPGEMAERRLRRQAVRQQAADITPERMYYEAALPQAQAEEESARQALLAQLSGGVLGPTLARGERRIGG